MPATTSTALETGVRSSRTRRSMSSSSCSASFAGDAGGEIRAVRRENASARASCCRSCRDRWPRRCAAEPSTASVRPPLHGLSGRTRRPRSSHCRCRCAERATERRGVPGARPVHRPQNDERPEGPRQGSTPGRRSRVGQARASRLMPSRSNAPASATRHDHPADLASTSTDAAARADQLGRNQVRSASSSRQSRQDRGTRLDSLRVATS